MKSTEIRIADHSVGTSHPPFVIAEVAQSHDGSLGMAHAFIDAAARSGASAVKFQTHIAEAESTPAEPWRVKFSLQDESRFQYWKRMEFTEEQWSGLADHAQQAGLVFLSSPFSVEAVELLERVGVPAWKVGSGEVTNDLLVERIAQTKLPILLSSGMSSWSELDRAVALIRRLGATLAVLQCTTAYPCPPERMGLNVIPALEERYGCPVGLSDHSATIFPSIAAVALGASLIEVHLTLSRDAFGPDVPASVTPDELAQLVRGTRMVHTARLHPVDKDKEAVELASLRGIFGKSVAVRRAMHAGEVLTVDALTTKKPGSGIPAARLSELVGRKLARDVEPSRLLEEADLD